MTEHPTIRTEADAVIEQTLLGIAPVELQPDSRYAIRTPAGFQLVDLTTDSALQAAGFNRNQPKSSYTFHTIESFTAYAESIAADKSEALCLADESSLTIKLISDAKPDQWGTVCAYLKLHGSPEADRWFKASGKYMAQQDFAEFCELNLESFESPSAATILEIAQTFQAKSTVDFSSAVRLSSGAIKLKRDETITATAGERADIQIPELLTVGLPLFKYGKTYAVQARLRYRVVDSAVKLSVLLVDPEMAIEHAFKEVVAQVAELLKMPVHYGKA